MINSDYVLIVSTVVDLATDDVVRRLARESIPHKRINTEDFPFSKSVSFQYGSDTACWLQIDNECFSVPRAVWYRRQRSAPKPEGMDGGVYEFCLQESRAALVGGLMANSARWMSHPAAIWRAEYKPYQLAVAAQLGFQVPRTIVSNDPAAIRRAVSEFGNIVVKPARSGYVVCEGQEFAIFTSRVTEEQLNNLEDAKWAPAIYQELVPKRFDIRVTVVGERIFSAAIHSQSDPRAIVDWRRTSNPNLPHHRVSLPDDLSQRVLALMRALDLRFAAIDFIQRTDGAYVFLEVNPNGQWLWLDDFLHLGISDAVATWLATPAPRCQS